MTDELERIALGGGCFWCTEAVFSDVSGVVEATPGYAGGSTLNPGYEEVCAGNTGHAEVVLVEYDSGKASLEELLDVFFSMHDPTTPGRQGNDIGTQYRSIILYESEGQRAGVEAFIAGIRGDYDSPVVTEVRPLETFYPAEEHHKEYFARNPRQPYCRLVISPKVEKLRKKLGRD
jgi:peptide-methionine (S)-S-oxide reductase